MCVLFGPFGPRFGPNFVAQTQLVDFIKYFLGKTVKNFWATEDVVAQKIFPLQAIDFIEFSFWAIGPPVYTGNGRGPNLQTGRTTAAQTPRFETVEILAAVQKTTKRGREALWYGNERSLVIRLPGGDRRR